MLYVCTLYVYVYNIHMFGMGYNVMEEVYMAVHTANMTVGPQIYE